MDVGKREDRMLDAMSTYKTNRDNTKALIDSYLEAQLITAEVASALWASLMGLEAAE